MIDFEDKGDASLFSSTKRQLARKQKEMVQETPIDIYTQAMSLFQQDPRQQAQKMDAMFKDNNKEKTGLVS